MASVGAESAYATGIIAVQRVYYNEVWSFACTISSAAIGWSMADAAIFQDQWMLFMSTQLIGFSIGGLGHRFLVAPASMSKPSRIFP
jgi:OPT oligopeptide transporter protein